MVEKPFEKREEEGYDRLLDILQRVMVKNKREDIHRDVVLPPCTISGEILWQSMKLIEIPVKKLKFSARETLRYNQFIAQIRVNFIASRGEGVDYMLSANNTRRALEAFNKLR